MSPATLLLTIILIQQGFIGLAWAAAAWAGLSRCAAWHWCAGALTMACSLALITQRPHLDVWTGFFVANLLCIAAALLMRRGAQRFSGAPIDDREHALVLGLPAAALALVLMLGAPEPWIVFVTSVAMAYSLLRGALELWQRLRFEFGVRAAWVLALPAGIAGGAFALRALLAPLVVSEFGRLMVSPGAGNARFGLFVLSAMLMLHFAFGGMAVMRLVKKLQHLSSHDPLTGVLNRRGLELRLDVETQRLNRYGQGFALLAVDLDHFKRVNDVHGHAAGDATLQAVARALATGLREVDSLGRMGGEEFVALLPHGDEAAARGAAERLLERVRQLPPPGERGAATSTLSVSIGIAVASDRRESRQELLRRLDAALYRAKEAGRDCAVAAEAPVSALRLAAD